MERDPLFEELEDTIKRKKFVPVENGEKQISKNLQYFPFEKYILFGESDDMSCYMFWTSFFESILSWKFENDIKVWKLIIENIEIQKNWFFDIIIKDIGKFNVKFYSLKNVELIYNWRSYKVDLENFFVNLLIEKIWGFILNKSFDSTILYIHTNLQKLKWIKLEEVNMDFMEKTAKLKMVLDFASWQIITLEIKQKWKIYKLDFGNFSYEFSA